MTNTNVFTPPFDIQISKLVKTMVVMSRLSNTCKSMMFWTILSNIFSTKIEQDGKQNKGIGATLILIARCFCMWKDAYTLCKFNPQGFQKTFVLIHHHVYKNLLSRKM